MDTKKKGVLRRVLSGVKTFATSPVNAYKNVKAAASIPYYVAKGNKAAREADIIKTARAYDGAPNIDQNGPTEAMKARVAAENIINPIGTKKIRPGINRRSLGWK